MVANSTTSQAQGKRSTSKTNALTPGQALEILQQSLIVCQQSGIKIDLASNDGKQGVSLVLANVVLANNNLVLANELPVMPVMPANGN